MALIWPDIDHPIAIALIRLHRDHFLQAIEESPDDPTQSYAGHSVTTVYVSASQTNKLSRG